MEIRYLKDLDEDSERDRQDLVLFFKVANRERYYGIMYRNLSISPEGELEEPQPMFYDEGAFGDRSYGDYLEMANRMDTVENAGKYLFFGAVNKAGYGTYTSEEFASAYP
jgi:hypothetical protein